MKKYLFLLALIWVIPTLGLADEKSDDPILMSRVNYLVRFDDN